MFDSKPRRPSVFYGWWIVGACFLIPLYINGTITYGFTAIFEPIANEFGWSYTLVSFAASIRGLETGFLAPLVGLFIDRLGARRVIFAGAAIAGLGLLLLGRVTSLLTFYGSFILIAVSTSTCTGVVPMTVVGKWFEKRVATATGIVVCGAALGGLLVPVVSQIIDMFGWRMAMSILGLGAWFILLPLSLVVRQKPQGHGYSPDSDMGGKLVSSEGMPSAQSTEVDIGVRQVLKSRVFWHIALGLGCNFLVIGTVLAHVMPYLSTVGVARSSASLVASALPLTSIIGRIGFGWLGDRFDRRWVTASGVALVGLSMLFFVYTSTARTWLIVPFIIFFGIGWGGPIPMVSALVLEYFGRVRLGIILGFVMSVTTVGNMIGPLLAGWVFDSFGSYHGAWFALIGVAIAGVVSLATTPSIDNTMQTATRLID